ncbi:MAG TPA: hypothetical protein VMQ52_00055 [Candidatus Saccharimonadales bacterium]|jgi:hypothetical protein|nr:hypothetical protein [Candidatus Saccharimonadales bacterium]
MQRNKPKLSKKDIDWQEKLNNKVKIEKVELNHPQGKERFDKIIRCFRNKKS